MEALRDFVISVFFVVGIILYELLWFWLGNYEIREANKKFMKEKKWEG